MQKIGRLVLFAIVSAVIVAGVLLLGVNLYVQSAGTHARIEQELSQRLGTTLRLQRISVTPWSGLKLSGITIPQVAPGVHGDFLAAKTFRLRVQWRSLFRERLVIKEIALVEPTVLWPQNAAGQWRVPESDVQPNPEPPRPTKAHPGGGAPAVPLPPEPPLPVASANPVARPPDDSGPAAAPPINAESEAAGTFTPEVRRVRLIGGNFRFLDGNGKPVATFGGVDFQSSFRTSSSLRGDTTIARTSLRDKFFLEQLHSPLSYEPAALEFSQISARAAAGEISGNFRLQPLADGSPFTVQVRFAKLQADKLITDAGGPAGMMQGTVEGVLEATGKTADADALSGAGEIRLRDGQVQQYALLVALGQMLQIEDLAHLHLDQAEVRYHISPGMVTIDELLVRSPSLRLSAKGTISFEGKLRLDSQLAIQDQVRQRLFRPLRDNFQSVAEPGYAAVAFQVTGTIEKPKTNLMTKLVGKDIKDLGSALSNIFGGSSKKKPKPPSAAPADPSPAPARPSEAAEPQPAESP